MDDALPSVLMVDDVEANLVGLEAGLSNLPCQLVRAGSGNEALQQLLKREFAVMLLDVQMPEMDGFEVARLARLHPKTKDVPIIFLTAMHATEANALKGYGSGAVDYLVKPFNLHVLRSKVRVFLDLCNQRRRLAEEIESHKRTLAELEAINLALRHFTDAASHDLRSPLRVMSGFLRAIQDETANQIDDTSRGYLERCVTASERMGSLLESLLAYARLQKPKPAREVDASVLVERAKTDLSDRIYAAKATVSVGRLPKVRGDPDRLYQLFLNLIGNALKFMKDQEKPRIEVLGEERSGAEVCFSVEDNGIGIREQDLERIFGAFQRLNSPDKYEGSGLGLAICKQIVEQHGGRIWVESKVGAGSKFFFTLRSPSEGGT